MSKKIDIIFDIITPLHIGYLQSTGNVISPTRYYVPGKNLWAAFTKEITENIFYKFNVYDKSLYATIGRILQKRLIFSFFFIYDDSTIYYPHYTNKGLLFGDNEKEKNNLINETEFVSKFIHHYTSTAINAETKTALDASLHDIEMINNYYLDNITGNKKHVRLIGCVYINNKNGINVEQINDNANKENINDNGINHAKTDNTNKLVIELELKLNNNIKNNITNQKSAESYNNKNNKSNKKKVKIGIEITREGIKLYFNLNQKNNKKDPDHVYIKRLTLGGESKYGFGYVEFNPHVKPNKNYCFIENLKDLKINNPYYHTPSLSINKDSYIYTFLKYDSSILFKGETGLIIGREYSISQANHEINTNNKTNDKISIITKGTFILPGSIIICKDKKRYIFGINYDGTLYLIDNDNNNNNNNNDDNK